MVKSFVKQLKLNKLFQADETKFILGNALKVAFVYLVTASFTIYSIWLILSLNNVFIEANGLSNFMELKTVYFDFIASQVLDNFIYIFVFFILLFFAGIYLTKILLRPFEIIGDYCARAIDDKNAVYNPDLFSDFKILTRFSEFFFQYISEARRKGELGTNTIPPTYTKVHGPVFDRVFFFHFSLFVSIIAIVSSVLILFITFDSYSSMVDLALSTIKLNSNNVSYYLRNQKFLFESIQIYSIIILIISYGLLALHLYAKVSGAVFGFFSTMRSFLKGNHSARIHLVGYPHIRPYSRAFNKFLDAVCREIEEGKKSND